MKGASVLVRHCFEDVKPMAVRAYHWHPYQPVGVCEFVMVSKAKTAVQSDKERYTPTEITVTNLLEFEIVKFSNFPPVSCSSQHFYILYLIKGHCLHCLWSLLPAKLLFWLKPSLGINLPQDLS
jgi:hypothetical protein